MFGSLVTITKFRMGSHKITLAVTSLSQTFEAAKLHMSLLYFITVAINQSLIE